MQKKKRGISSYAKIILSEKWTVTAVVRKMNIATSTLYHYIEGKNTFPVDLTLNLYNATSDLEVLNFVVTDTKAHNL